MPGWLYALVGWVGGVVSTVAGSWISSKIQVYHQKRQVHLEAIRDKVLIRLRSGLADHLRPFVTQQVPVVSVKLDSLHFKDKATVTEDPTEWATLIVADFHFGRVFDGIELALLEDAKKSHYIELIATMDSLFQDWIDYARDCHMWVSEMAVKIFDKAALPAFLPNRSRPYVMQCDLATFIYRRLFRFSMTGSLQKSSDHEGWLLNYGAQSIAAGSKDQMDALIGILDGLVESQKPLATALQQRRAELQKRFDELSGRLDSAIASQRLHGRCDLVTFL